MVLLKNILSGLAEKVDGDVTVLWRVLKWGKTGLEQLTNDDFTAMNAFEDKIHKLHSLTGVIRH